MVRLLLVLQAGEPLHPVGHRLRDVPPKEEKALAPPHLEQPGVVVVARLPPVLVAR